MQTSGTIDFCSSNQNRELEISLLALRVREFITSIILALKILHTVSVLKGKQRKKMSTHSRLSWSLDNFSLSILQEMNSRENMPTDVKV